MAVQKNIKITKHVVLVLTEGQQNIKIAKHLKMQEYKII